MNKIKKSILIATILFTFVFIFSNCVSAADPTKELITQTPTGGAENSQSANPSVSADGRYVAFQSGASNIGNGSSGRGIQDIYVYDRATNTTEWITHTQFGGAANGDSYSPSISSKNGNYTVAFVSVATNLGPDPSVRYGSGNGIKDIFVYNSTTKSVTWITHSPNGDPASNHSSAPVISADGTTLAFQSTAKNLGTGGSEYYVSDIYIYDLTSNASNNYPVWITHTIERKTANGASMNPSISADGRYIAFETLATNLGSNPNVKFGTGNGIKDIFVYDSVLKKFSWITIRIPNVWADFPGGPFTVPFTVGLNMDEPGTIYWSYNGVAWNNYTSVQPVITTTTYLYFYGNTTDGRVSSLKSEYYILSSGGSQPLVWASPSQGTYYNYVDVDLFMDLPGAIYYSLNGGSYVTYADTIKITQDTFLRFFGISSNTNIKSAIGSEEYIIIGAPIGGINPSISADGSLLAFESGNNIYFYNAITGKTKLVTQTILGGAANGTSVNPSISGNGKYIAFESLANNLGPDPNQPYGSNVEGIIFWSGNRRVDIFVYDMEKGIFNWVTKNPNYGPANGNSYTPSLNYDGTVLAYSSSANNLGPGGSGVYRDIFLEDSGLQVTVDKKAGSYKGPLTVRLSVINGLGDIYYTINGKDPQTSAGIKYTGPIIITADTLLRYSGKGSDGVWSLNYSQKYVIKKSPTVTVNPVGGTYTTVKTVTLTTKDPDSTATTYYTTDGSDPKTSGTRKTYKNPIQIGSTTVLRFIAVDPDGNWSPSYKQTYTINLPKNTITIAQLNSAAASVRKYYETNSKKLPPSVKINGKTYTMAQLLYLLVTATINMNTNNLNPITAKTVNSAPSPSGTIKNGNIQKTSYISYAKSIQKYINTNGRVPNYVSTNLGKMQFKYMVYMYTKIVDYFVSNKRLPNYVAMTK